MTTSLPSLTLAAFTLDLWEHVCPQVRLLAPASAAGIEIVRASQPGESEMPIDLEAISRADLVIILRDFPRAAEAYAAVMQEARRQGKKVVYELDDLLIDLPSTHPDAAFYRTVRYRLISAAVDADALIVTTDNLRHAMLPYHPQVLVVPNFLDDSLWGSAFSIPAPTSPDHAPLVIGYQGGRGHIPDLESVSEALLHVLQRHGQKVKFKLVHHPPSHCATGQMSNGSILGSQVTPHSAHISSARPAISLSRPSSITPSTPAKAH